MRIKKRQWLLTVALLALLLLGSSYAASASKPPPEPPAWNPLPYTPGFSLSDASTQQVDGFTTMVNIGKNYWANNTTPKEVEFRAYLSGSNFLSATLHGPTRRSRAAREILALKVNEEPLVVDPGYNLLNQFGQMYYKIGPVQTMETMFPLGKYVFQILYYDVNNKQRARGNSVHDLPLAFPPRPVITYPQYNQTGVELAPLIRWEKTPDSPDFSYYFIDLGQPVPGTPNWKGLLSVRVENIAQTQYQLPAGLLQPGGVYGLWLGVSYQGSVVSKAGINFTTAP